MRPILLLLLLSVCNNPAASQSVWNMQRDDLSEYQLDKTAGNFRSSRDCAYLADARHQAVQFSQSDGTCRMYSCLRGLTGCRKCRNAKNASLPLLLVRSLNQLGHNCWRTFQHRVDASVDFYRNWIDYLTSFGQGEDLNYWMGLEAIYQLTKNGDRRARWEMSMWNGSWFWWEDASFTLQGAAQGYLLTIGEQDLANSNVVHCSLTFFAYMNNQRFSTPDKDQDSSGDNCAVKYQGAWWYSGCHCFNPNGRYFTPPTALNLNGNLIGSGLTFFSSPGNAYPLNHDYSMQTFECMVSDIVQ